MSVGQYSSFDRGFDLDRSDEHSNAAPVIERELMQRMPSRAPWRRFLAFAMVAIMTIAAFAVIIPAGERIIGGPQSPEADQPADIEIGGTRNVTYTISNMFEIYNKSTDYADLGKHTTPGFSAYWWDRLAYGYPDTPIRNTYPYMMLYDGYSAEIATSIKDPRMAFGTYSFFRLSVDAKNLDRIATGPGKLLNFIPMLNSGGLGSNGGFVNWSWHIDYLTVPEETAIMAGTHYANTYYGVHAGDVMWGGSDYNDGWWNELHGKMNFSREAAKKFLGLPGNTGDLRSEFNTSNERHELPSGGWSLGGIDVAWAKNWTDCGDANGTTDIYCAYDWPINSGSVQTFLTLDAWNSTKDKLELRIWGRCWGYDILMERFLDKYAGVATFFQNYIDDEYLNGSAAPNGVDLTVRTTAIYHMLAWKDMLVNNAAWNMDTVHIDACINTAKHPLKTWKSYYNPYGSYGGSVANPRPQKMQWSPGTTNYGTRVMYWCPPLGFNLTANEKIVIKLPTAPGLGVELYKGASDVIDQTKAAEIRSNSFWGEVVLGHGYPDWLYSTTYYNHATKTITLQGHDPGGLVLNSDPNENLLRKNRNETGSPDFMFAVSKVSTYDVVMDVGGTYTSGVPYGLTVTAKDYAGNPISNGTVALTCYNNAGTVIAGSPHTFTLGEAGVWHTTVTFGQGGSNTYINATSGEFPLDVNGASAKLVVLLIPEFPMLVLPIVGAAAMVVAIRRFTKKE